MSTAREIRVRRAFGIANVAAAAIVVFGMFALPARWWPVDAGAVAVAALLAGSGSALFADLPWAERAARAASLAVLVVGLAFVATLALTASYLSGIYGAVGRGGAIILVLVGALVVPYAVLLPAAQLVWLGAKGSDAR